MKRDAELEVFGTTHAQVGAYLLWLWGLPAGVTEIVARYDRPGPETPSVALLAVHVANALISEGPEQSIDADWLAAMGLFERLAEWRQMGEEMKQ